MKGKPARHADPGAGRFIHHILWQHPQTFMLVRMAALATLDAAPASWLMNIAVSGEAGLDPELILGTLIAIAPVIGTARVVSAAGNILSGLALGEASAESAEG
jgi:4-carboxymuconolactone decarboxylase